MDKIVLIVSCFLSSSNFAMDNNKDLRNSYEIVEKNDENSCENNEDYKKPKKRSLLVKYFTKDCLVTGGQACVIITAGLLYYVIRYYCHMLPNEFV